MPPSLESSGSYMCQSSKGKATRNAVDLLLIFLLNLVTRVHSYPCVIFVWHRISFIIFKRCHPLSSNCCVITLMFWTLFEQVYCSGYHYLPTCISHDSYGEFRSYLFISFCKGVWVAPGCWDYTYIWFSLFQLKSSKLEWGGMIWSLICNAQTNGLEHIFMCSCCEGSH